MSTPLIRVLRTVLQVLAAAAVVVPTVVHLLGLYDVSVNGPALVAILGATTLVVATIHDELVQSPSGRPLLRTLVQLVIALAGIVPAFVALLATGGIHANGVTLAAIASTAVVVATAVQNVLEHRGVVPKLGRPFPALRGGTTR